MRPIPLPPLRSPHAPLLALAGLAIVTALLTVGLTRRRRRPIRAWFRDVRPAGPASPADDWDRVDQASDESFPASDAPGWR